MAVKRSLHQNAVVFKCLVLLPVALEPSVQKVLKQGKKKIYEREAHKKRDKTKTFKQSKAIQSKTNTKIVESFVFFPKSELGYCSDKLLGGEIENF